MEPGFDYGEDYIRNKNGNRRARNLRPLACGICEIRG
jgi:hypothetical protein